MRALRSIPMKTQFLATCLLFAASVAAAASGAPKPAGTDPGAAATSPSWNPQTAADYLDSREVWWQAWPRAQKDHGTLCISCHTVVPYALARPALEKELHESTPPAPERSMLASVEKRVSNWPEMAPFYSDAANGPGKTAEAHATEAVLNAAILASYDAREGHLRSITRTAFDEVWALQETTGEKAGAWKWQNFHLSPWESDESAYQGSALLAVAVGHAPDGYAQQSEVREHVRRLREFLRQNFAAQPLMSQLYVLWASPRIPGLLTRSERRRLLAATEGLQQADGGWRLASLDPRHRLDDTAEPDASDGMATGLVVLTLDAAGTSSRNPSLLRGVAWLRLHQEKDGSWQAASLNKQRDPANNAALFMTDAATGYAVLALESARSSGAHQPRSR